MLTTENVLLVAAAFLVGGLVKGTIGLGLPVVVLTALVFVMPLRDAMAVFLVPGIEEKGDATLSLPIDLRRYENKRRTYGSRKRVASLFPFSSSSSAD